MKTIKFTRDVLVHGEHRSAGTIHQIENDIAIDLIRAGDAIPFTAPEKEGPETADSKAPKAAEKAARK